MQITIFKSKHKAEKIEDLLKNSQYVSFQIEKPEELKREMAMQLLNKTYYQLFEKEKSNKLREELKLLEGKKDEESIKRIKEILDTQLNG